MSIKRKKVGPTPIFPERWQELAKDESRLAEAAREYCLKNPNVSLTEAARKVRAFRTANITTRGRR